MAEYVEGKRPVIEAMKTDVPLKKILLADNAKRDPMVNDILRKSRQRDIPVIDVPRAELDSKSARGTAESYAAEHDGRALVVVCDHLTDAGNLGAIIRSAESVGASGVIIPNKRSAHVEASTYKSSAGAVAHLPIAQTSNIVNALERFKKEGFWVCAATEHSSNELWDVNLKGKIVLVMGNEQEGISHLVLENCDMAGKLPMMGEIQSLNVAQSATACMYEWLRQNW